MKQKWLRIYLKVHNIVYEDIEYKLNEIYQEFGKMYNTNSKFKLANLIKDNFKIKDTERIKNILTKIINKDISLDESKNSKMNIISKLFYFQNK